MSESEEQNMTLVNFNFDNKDGFDSGDVWDKEFKEAHDWLKSLDRTTVFQTTEDMLVAYHRYREEKKWVSVKERLPEPLEQVLAVVKHDYGTTVMMAEYVPPKTILAEDFVNEDYGDGLDEYDEEKDCYWTKEGWFEWQHEAEVHYLICGDVTHWQPLPQPPKE